MGQHSEKLEIWSKRRKNRESRGLNNNDAAGEARGTIIGVRVYNFLVGAKQ